MNENFKKKLSLKFGGRYRQTHIWKAEFSHYYLKSLRKEI